jgi:short-subunit dehydrogenase
VIRVSAGARAVVTGASSGIGQAIAARLAARGLPLVLVARSAGVLAERAAEWRARHGVAVEAVPLDLARPGAAAELFDRTEGAGTPVDLLVNAAGFGWNGPQAGMETSRLLELLRLNVLATAELTHLFLRTMTARKRGAILNVASTSGFYPMPYFAAYGASKAFLLSFTHALHEEAKRDGVTLTALCPGYTRTNFYAVAGMRGAEGTPFPEMTADAVAEAGLRALEEGKPFTVTHWLDRLWIASGRLVPRSVPARLGAVFFSRTRL